MMNVSIDHNGNEVQIPTVFVNASDRFEIPVARFKENNQFLGFEYNMQSLDGSSGKTQLSQICICGADAAVIGKMGDARYGYWGIDGRGVNAVVAGGGGGGGGRNGNGGGGGYGDNDHVGAADDEPVPSLLGLLANGNVTLSGAGSKRLREEFERSGVEVSAQFIEVKKSKDLKKLLKKYKSKNQRDANLVRCAYFAAL